MSSKTLLHLNLRLTIALVCGLVAGPSPALSATSARSQPGAKSAALPESIVVRLPHKDLSVQDVQLQWYRQAQRYRPAGKGLERKRAFVDQLIEKEILARAAATRA